MVIFFFPNLLANKVLLTLIIITELLYPHQPPIKTNHVLKKIENEIWVT